MKVVEIVPRERTRLYGMLVAKEAAIRKGGRGTYVRVGRKTKYATRWKHRNYRGSAASTTRQRPARAAGARRCTNSLGNRPLASQTCALNNRHCVRAHGAPNLYATPTRAVWV